MAGASINSYGSEWGVGFLWHRLDLLVCIDVVVLGFLLAWTLFVITRVFRCCRRAQRDEEISSATGRKLIAELTIQVGNLKSISSAAPYLGLMGACVGLLTAFSGIGMQRNAAIALMTSRIAAALLPTAAGILVAIPSTCGYEYARTRLDLLVNELPGRKRLYTTRLFTLPPFAVIAAFLLIILMRVYGAITPGPSPKGFDVDIASTSCDGESERLMVLQLSNDGKVFLNFEEQQDWSTLQHRLSEIYGRRVNRILYLRADEGIPFQKVADAIDIVSSTSDEFPSPSLNIVVRLITPRSMNARCPGFVPQRLKPR